MWDTMYILKLLTEPYTPTLGLLTDWLTYLSTECSYKIGKGEILIWPNSYKVSGSRSPGQHSLDTPLLQQLQVYFRIPKFWLHIIVPTSIWVSKNIITRIGLYLHLNKKMQKCRIKREKNLYNLTKFGKISYFLVHF